MGTKISTQPLFITFSQMSGPHVCVDLTLSSDNLNRLKTAINGSLNRIQNHLRLPTQNTPLLLRLTPVPLYPRNQTSKLPNHTGLLRQLGRHPLLPHQRLPEPGLRRYVERRRFLVKRAGIVVNAQAGLGAEHGEVQAEAGEERAVERGDLVGNIR